MDALTTRCAAGACGEPEFVDSGDAVARGARGDFADEIGGQNFFELAGAAPRRAESQQLFDLRIPGFDAVFEIDGEDADVAAIRRYSR